MIINRSGPQASGTSPADGQKLLFRAVAVSSFWDGRGDRSVPLATGAKRGCCEVCFRGCGNGVFALRRSDKRDVYRSLEVAGLGLIGKVCDVHSSVLG